MSGGSHNYEFQRVQSEYSDRMGDVELNAMIDDLVPLLKSLEWWKSGDTTKEDYMKDVMKFKARWFGRSPGEPYVEYENALQKACDKMKRELHYRFPEKN